MRHRVAILILLLRAVSSFWVVQASTASISDNSTQYSEHIRDNPTIGSQSVASSNVNLQLHTATATPSTTTINPVADPDFYTQVCY